MDPADGSVAIVEFDTFDRGCDPLALGGYGAISCAERNLGRISRVSCAWTADTTIDGRPPAPFQCCCVEPGAPGPTTMGCTLSCPPPTASPPAAPPTPPLPPPLPPDALRVNVSEAVPPAPLRDYSRMVIDDETLLFVGGFVTAGTQAVSWGDPTTVALVSAVRVAPPSPPGEWPLAGAGTLQYGACASGCGRPTGVDACVACQPGSFGTGDGTCEFCRPGLRGRSVLTSFNVSIDENTTHTHTRLEPVARGGSSDEACEPCPLGSYNPLHGAQSCRVCPAGAFCADGFVLTEYGILSARPLSGGITLPVLCPVGTFNPLVGASDPSACERCPAGTANPTPGGVSNTSCVPCLPGSASGVQASHCEPCAPSSAQPAVGAPQCDICPPGTYANVTGLTSCRLCPTGSHGPFEGEVAHECRPCGAGTYADVRGSVACALCPNGTASSATRAHSNATCDLCTGASFSLAMGAVQCTPCPNGTASGESAHHARPALPPPPQPRTHVISSA